MAPGAVGVLAALRDAPQEVRIRRRKRKAYRDRLLISTVLTKI